MEAKVCGDVSQGEIGFLSNYLPQNHRYCVCDLETSDADESFSTTIAIDIKTEEGAKQWFQEYQAKTKTTMRISHAKSTHAGSSCAVNLYKVRFRCQHNTRSAVTVADKHSSKNTNCPASMSITVKRSGGRLRRKNNEHAIEFPTTVKLSFQHNHNIDSADALRHRDVSDETRKKFVALFETGHSPGSAREAYKYAMQCEDGEQFTLTSADRSLLPDVQWCYRLYYSLFNQAYGESNGIKLTEDLKTAVEKCNEGGKMISMAVDNGQLAMAIVTPLMRRASATFRQSGELLFVDSTRNMDRNNVRVLLLMTHTCVGGLPVGCLITASESATSVDDALALFVRLAGEDAFYGRGTRGPEMIMTGDADSERSAMRKVYPESELLLCVFHVLQAAWRWLWTGKHGVSIKHRHILFRQVKNFLYSDTEEALAENFKTLTENSVVKLYIKFRDYVSNLYERRNEWAICLRTHLQARGKSTNDYCEASMRVLRDKVLGRTKAFNVIHLLDFIVTRMDCYYQQKLTDVANNRFDSAKLTKFMPPAPKVDVAKIRRLSEMEFEVPSDGGSSYHTVDIQVAVCTCYVGKTGAACKHQAAVVKGFDLTCLNFVPNQSPAEREKLKFVATGEDTNDDDEWFSSLDMVEFEETVCSEPEQANTPAATQQMDISESDNQHALATNRDTEDLLDLFNRISERMQSAEGAELFRPAVRAFIRSGHALQTDSALASALTTFGRYSPGMRKRGLTGVKRISVQRRKRMAGGGRKKKLAGAAY